MPQHKSQHYVPLCYLRPFASNVGGAAINLFNISRHSTIQNAPIKGQCARDYFYGKDLKLEKILQGIEGQYAQITKKLLDRPKTLTPSDTAFLKDFTYLQHRRSETAADNLRSMKSEMESQIFDGREDLKPNDVLDGTWAIFASVKIFQESVHLIADLKTCIVHNLTDRSFVAGDDPATRSSPPHSV